MSVYKFFYDESGNSREINQNTVTANNYSDNFITAIVGWDSSRDKEIEEEYAAFESKYSYRMSAGEIKSSSIKDKQIRNGFASTNKETTQFLLDYLTVMENVSLYFCVMSKIEYVVWQLFDNYRGVPFILEKNFMYSLVKAINVYRPQTVIDCIYNHPEDLVDVLEDFLCQRIEANKDNPSLKSRESHVFEQIIGLLTDVSLEIKRGEFASLMGASGSGKSTLLYLIGGLDTEYDGNIYIAGQKMTGMHEKEMSALRLQKIGFVFQFYNLIHNLTVEENILLPIKITNTGE